jgi:GNAT superfamily N-acetyltransferase
VEGVSSTRREVTVPWALTVWVEAPRELRLERALARDGEAMRGQWLDHWMPSEDAYVARDHPQQRVDLLVSGVIEAVTIESAGRRRLARLGERVIGTWDGPGTAPLVEPPYRGHGIEQALIH